MLKMEERNIKARQEWHDMEYLKDQIIFLTGYQWSALKVATKSKNKDFLNKVLLTNEFIKSCIDDLNAQIKILRDIGWEQI